MRTVKTSTNPSYLQCITLNPDRVALLEPTSRGFFHTFFGEEIRTGPGWTYLSICFSCLQILGRFWVEWSFGGASVVQIREEDSPSVQGSDVLLGNSKCPLLCVLAQ
jgi:hypothetical protein